MHCSIAILAEVWALAERFDVLHRDPFPVLDVGEKLFSKGTKNSTPSTLHKIEKKMVDFE